MLGIDVLDVAIGLAFVYLLLSLIVTAANEMFAAWFKRRAWMLQKGLSNFIDDPAIVTELYDHPLIRTLFEPRSRLSQLPGLSSVFGNGPSYIPAHTFATALLDVVDRRNVKQGGPPADGAPGALLQRGLAVLLQEAGQDREQLKKSVEVWFSDSMERVSGWYKRYTQALSVFWAVMVVIGMNADTLTIGRALWSDPALRQATVVRAEQWTREHADQMRPASTPSPAADDAVPPPPLPPYEQADVDFREAETELKAALADLNALNLPIGWRGGPAVADEAVNEARLVNPEAESWPGLSLLDRTVRDQWWTALANHLGGWLLTILAVSLGAPFWFDVLNKFVSIRSAGKAPEEEPKSPRKVPTPKEPGTN